jgi:hypothetical protein
MRSSVISSGITTSRYYSSNIVVYPRSTPCALSGPVVNEKLKKLSPSELLPWNPISVNHDFEEFPILECAPCGAHPKNQLSHHYSVIY